MNERSDMLRGAPLKLQLLAGLTALAGPAFAERLERTIERPPRQCRRCRAEFEPERAGHELCDECHAGR